jgi:hypothetical protein
LTGIRLGQVNEPLSNTLKSTINSFNLKNRGQLFPEIDIQLVKTKIMKLQMAENPMFASEQALFEDGWAEIRVSSSKTALFEDGWSKIGSSSKPPYIRRIPLIPIVPQKRTGSLGTQKRHRSFFGSTLE